MQQVPYCERCGSFSTDPVKGCSSCRMIDEMTAHWEPERREQFLADQRGAAEIAHAQVSAEMAGKSQEQLLAESEEEQRIRDALSPDIPLPAAAANGKSYADMNPQERAEVERWRQERRFALPKTVPPLQHTVILHRCSELGGSDGPIDRLALAFNATGFWWGMDAAEPEWLSAVPWQEMRGIEIDGPETIESRITLPRAAAFGLFSLGMKKSKKRAYLTLSTAATTRVFQIDDLNAFELKAQLAPVCDWWARYSSDIQALAAVL